MIILGIVLVVIGLLTGISILTTIGVLLVVVGLIFAILGVAHHPVGGRKYWF